ncbi:MAG TPA: carboxypeptidase-like regulatory domain-containing protein, partial [Bacteroidia bacterium]|nr:carboxypeptidase-like regulatory domain-containing protein [Bacteroidia bacterium]
MLRFIFLSFLFVQLQAQVVLSGKITEEKSGLPIPYTSIGISGKHYGTLSNADGFFTLKLPYLTDKDTLKISAIGYESATFAKPDMKGFTNKVISLKPLIVNLNTVDIKAKIVKRKVLGTTKYSTRNCTAFVTEDENWLGSQAAILAGNKKGQSVYIENFSFYIIKNTFEDSIKFRLMFYAVSPKGYPYQSFLKRPVVFKTNVKQGIVTIDLKDYYITTDDDFFISLECLEEKMDATKFCFAGSVNT